MDQHSQKAPSQICHSSRCPSILHLSHVLSIFIHTSYRSHRLKCRSKACLSADRHYRIWIRRKPLFATTRLFLACLHEFWTSNSRMRSFGRAAACLKRKVCPRASFRCTSPKSGVSRRNHTVIEQRTREASTQAVARAPSLLLENGSEILIITTLDAIFQQFGSVFL